MTKRGILVLEDGSKFEGKVFGSQNSTAGEVVFSTGMVGYEQSLTDPSYRGQILTFTYPLIGNWGVPKKDYWESERIQVAGLVISDLTVKPSHHLSQKSLNQWLQEHNIVGISEIDTRALTQQIREKGAMLGKIVVDNQDIDFDNPNDRNLVAEVSPKTIQIHKPNYKSPQPVILNPQGEGPKKILRGIYPETLRGVYPERTRRAQSDSRRTQNDKRGDSIKIGFLNCGAKKNITKNLVKRNFTVYELPWDFDPFENNLGIEGLVISNGPGDPKMPKKSIEIIKKSLEKKLPTFGICLGNQLLTLAAGGDTYKLKFGHRAQNQPTIDVNTKRCYITTQNHGFAVSEKKLPNGFKRWFYNANDNTNEGLIHEKLPFLSVQFHPEATPGPYDTEWLFDYFLEKFR